MLIKKIVSVILSLSLVFMVSGCQSDKDNPLHGKDTDERVVMCLENAYPEYNFKVVKSFDKQKNEGLFEDENGKTNKSLADVDGQLLMVSQFTLYANCKKGNRPSFTEAGEPHRAEELYEYTVAKAREQVPVVETGVFGAEMEVSLVNDGPFTVILEDL